ncbi:MAG: hypothetical protein PVS3B1_28230 [Ktedonobacteraceae bacterium]
MRQGKIGLALICIGVRARQAINALLYLFARAYQEDIVQQTTVEIMECCRHLSLPETMLSLPLVLCFTRCAGTIK